MLFKDNKFSGLNTMEQHRRDRLIIPQEQHYHRFIPRE